VQNEIN